MRGHRDGENARRCWLLGEGVTGMRYLAKQSPVMGPNHVAEDVLWQFGRTTGEVWDTTLT